MAKVSRIGWAGICAAAHTVMKSGVITQLTTSFRRLGLLLFRSLRAVIRTRRHNITLWTFVPGKLPYLDEGSGKGSVKVPSDIFDFNLPVIVVDFSLHCVEDKRFVEIGSLGAIEYVDVSSEVTFELLRKYNALALEFCKILNGSFT